MLCPVTKLAPGEARNTAAAFRSSNWPSRPAGVLSTSAYCQSPVRTSVCCSLGNIPGQIEFTVTPRAAKRVPR